MNSFTLHQHISCKRKLIGVPPLILAMSSLMVSLTACSTAGGSNGSAAYILTPAEKSIIKALPAPRSSGIDKSGSCTNTDLTFENQDAQSVWPAPNYGLPLRLWGAQHAGARADISSPPCTDMQFIVRLWQSAIGSPVTGRLSKKDAAEFVRIVDANAPNYVQIRHSSPLAKSNQDEKNTTHAQIQRSSQLSKSKQDEFVGVFLAKAQQGDAKSQFRVADVYQSYKNYPEAIKWYRKAADQGLTIAQEKLGEMYKQGLGVDQNTAEAKKWLGKADQSGSQKAVYALAELQQGDAKQQAGQVKLETIFELLGNSYEKVSGQLSDVLCHSEGDQILCVREDPCNNLMRRQSGMREVASVGQQPPQDRTPDEVAQSIIGIVRGWNPEVKRANELQTANELSRCRARYLATAEANSELSFAGRDISKALLSFNNGVFVGMEMRVGHRYGSNQEQIDQDSQDINKWITLNIGEPTDIIGHVAGEQAASCMGGICNDTPVGSWSTTWREYIWRTPRLRVHGEGSHFEFDLISKR